MHNKTTTKAIVVDDHPLFRRGVVELLNESNQFEVIKSFGSAIELIDSMPFTPPDILLLDLQMPEMSGIEALKRLRSKLQDTKIVILTVSADTQSLMDAISIGADGYLLKDTDPEQILKQLSSVMEGKIAITESGVNILAQGIRSQGHTNRTSDSSEFHGGILKDMTEREKQTLELISKGLSNKLIGRQLGISDATVKVYVKNLLRKLGLHSRLELAAWNHKHKTFHSDVDL
ncbi:response regulator [Thiomicrorhabdus sp.]|uniref:response regulator n=1 Tax=Thiomicrorhabdus sp. TaxID=2039724 RepID=UPI002AA6CF46|nr:response regulator [Thiomicrorhabdus sp.]